MAAYRMTPRSLGYGIAGVAAFSILAGAVGGLKHTASVGGVLLFVAIAVFGAAASLGIAALAHGSEVRTFDAGIMSIGLSTVQLIRWQDVARFEVDRYRSSPYTVYAVLDDGSRIALEPLRGGSSQEQRVQQFSDKLTTKLRDEQLRNGAARARPEWPRVPIGWRRRARVIETPSR